MVRSSLLKLLVPFLGAIVLSVFLARETTVLADAAASGSSSSQRHGEPGTPPAQEPSLSERPVQSEFPRHAETEFERSVIHIPVRLANETEPREILELTAFMRLEREVPVRNTIGYRQVEFTIREWELFGYSEVLGAHVAFSGSHEAIQPKSLILSLQKGSDYPALIVYNAIYDVFLDGRKIVSQRPGVAMARGILEIPPRNITVAFQKPIVLGDLDLGLRDGEVAERNHGDCAQNPDDYRCYILDPGTCDDMTPIAFEEFEAGRREAIELREQLATLKPKPSKPSAGTAATAGKKGRG